jgi:hypothetical protein
MPTRTLVRIITLAVLTCVTIASCAAPANQPTGQTSENPTWLPCPQCQTDAERAEARAETANLSFDPRNLSGVWGQNRVQLSVPAPALTERGEALYQATLADSSSDGSTQTTNTKDGMLICDPLGWPRWFTYNYGFEFAQLPNRVVQFIEWGHAWRDIWTDGRALPEDPDPRWLGYSVGRWEGDTFVVESNGFDDRSWLSENREERRYGWPHSDGLRTEERYRRVGYNSLEATLTITDPQVYTESWVTADTLLLSPGSEIGEFFCVPSEFNQFNEELITASEQLTPGTIGPRQ